MAELTGFQLLCAGQEIEERSKGVRFSVRHEDGYTRAFAVRFDGKVCAFLNQCAHQAIELDWNEGEFFDTGRRYLVCATHGALYDPIDGRCISGRCQGRGLTALNIIETAGGIYVQTDHPVIR